MKTITKTTDLRIKNSLKRWYESATPAQIESGLLWYSEAQTFVTLTATEFGLDRYVVAGVVSALSPNNKWERNKIDAVTVIKAYLNGIDADSVKVCTYGANKRKAFAILAEGKQIVASAPKTHAFAMNVGLLSADHVTVDKWHIRACLIRPKDGVTPTVESCTQAQYRRIEAITAGVAHSYGLKGYELQAIIWITIKENWRR